VKAKNYPQGLKWISFLESYFTSIDPFGLSWPFEVSKKATTTIILKTQGLDFSKTSGHGLEWQGQQRNRHLSLQVWPAGRLVRMRSNGFPKSRQPGVQPRPGLEPSTSPGWQDLRSQAGQEDQLLVREHWSCKNFVCMIAIRCLNL